MSDNKLSCDFECVVCMVISEEPYMLSTCGHSFCKACLLSLSNPSIICPICRKECPNISLIVKNYALIDFIKRNKEPFATKGMLFN